MAEQLPPWLPTTGKPEIRRSLAEGLIVCPQFQMEEGEHLAFGQAFHTFIAAYTRHLQARQLDSDLTMVRTLASEAWAGTEGLRHDRHDEFLELCDRFGDTHAGDTAGILTVEQTLVRDVGFAIVNCTPDRIDRTDDGDPDDPPTRLRITDFKSEQGEAEHGFQERWYVRQAELEWPSVREIEFVFDWPRSRREPEGRVWERGELDQWWETQMEALRLRLLARNAPPRGGPACESCRLRRTCGAALSQYAAIPTSDEEADVVLEEQRRLAAAADVRWQALASYYRQGRKPRVVAGEEVGWLETREASWFWLARPSAVAAWFMRHGMDWRPFVGIVARSLANKGLREQAIADGIGEERFKPEEFKTRKAEPERKKARRQRAREQTPSREET